MKKEYDVKMNNEIEDNKPVKPEKVAKATIKEVASEPVKSKDTYRPATVKDMLFDKEFFVKVGKGNYASKRISQVINPNDSVNPIVANDGVIYAINEMFIQINN